MIEPGPRDVQPGLDLPPEVIEALRSQLGLVAEKTVERIVVEVPSYVDAFSGGMGQTIERAVHLALDGFLDMLSHAKSEDSEATMSTARGGAFDLGRGEARSGRSMDALLAAYRVGARVSWREFATTTVAAGVSGEIIAEFAELVFAYIDELSAASVAGHTDELDRSGRIRRRHLDRLAISLLSGDAADIVISVAERASWAPPKTLTAVLLPVDQVRGLMVHLDPRTLELSESAQGLELGEDFAILLVPNAGGRNRQVLVRALRDRRAVVGPVRPWLRVQASFVRARRASDLGLGDGTGPVDTDDHLAELVVGADREALADLRARVLAPLDELRPSAAEKLADTLRAWLLHHGRRDAIAEVLFVHPQTVRYRMGQIRQIYGERLEDPDFVRDATIALGLIR